MPEFAEFLGAYFDTRINRPLTMNGFNGVDDMGNIGVDNL